MRRSVWFLAALLGACRTAGRAAPTPSAPTPSVASAPATAGPAAAPGPRAGADTARPSLLVPGPPPAALLWTRASAEHRAILMQSYDGATARLKELIAGQPRDGWAVIMDADETVLDNSPYFQRQAARGYTNFTGASWIAFVREAIAPALPGAVAFTRTVHELGGRVVIVTNRAENLCADTRRNLERAGIQTDAVLCKPAGTDDKNPRFADVQQGRVAGLPALRVAMWVGDNIQDFPGMTQGAARDAADAAFREFGRSWWILPNPIYGSWERNPLPPQ